MTGFVARLALVLLSTMLGGCVYTVATNAPPPVSIQPPPPASPPRLEYTVGDFAFTLEGGKMVTSHYVGKTLSGQIMSAWKERGYISDAQFVENGAFGEAAPYRLTLHGSQYGESSIVMQILSGLTFFLLPYSVTQQYDLQLLLEDARSGSQYSARVQGSGKAWIQLVLIFALLVGQRGHEETVRNIGDHLYEQLVREGAFQPPPQAP